MISLGRFREGIFAVNLDSSLVLRLFATSMAALLALGAQAEGLDWQTSLFRFLAIIGAASTVLHMARQFCEWLAATPPERRRALILPVLQAAFLVAATAGLIAVTLPAYFHLQTHARTLTDGLQMAFLMLWAYAGVVSCAFQAVRVSVRISLLLRPEAAREVS